MKNRALYLAMLVGMLLALWGGSSCDAGSDGPGGNASGGSAAAAASGGSGAEGGCFLCGGGGTGGGNAGTIIISPQNPVLDVVDGTIPTQAFTAELNGQDITNQVTWVYDRTDIGDIPTSNVFTPTGNVGGVGNLLALFSDAEGSTTVTVNVTITVNPAGLTPSEQDQFDNPSGPDPSLSFVYPYDQTVMPLKVASPQFQWNGGGAADVYRLRLSSNYITYTVFFNAPPAPMMHALAQQEWENIQFSGTGPVTDPLSVALSRMTGGNAYDPQSVQLGIAQGFVYGAVYYWQLPDACGGASEGKILRIRPDQNQTEEFYFPAAGVCWGCHTVSRDGTQMMASFDMPSYPFPVQTIDLSQNPAQLGAITQATGLTGTFSAYNDTGSRLLLSDNMSMGPNASATHLHIIDSATGQYTAQNALGPGCGEGAWSPDGTKLAAICGMTNGGWTFDASTGNLAVADVNANGDAVTNQTNIVPQGSPGRPAYPSFSPDSQYLTYGRPTSGSRSTGNGTLWIVGVDGANPTELTNMSDDNHSFNPVFAPKSAGGYYWVVFISRRDYGNQLVGSNRQQLWMAAIDDPLPAAGDPSHRPFYMLGQESCGKSENAYYALEPCKEIGEECTAGIECCNGQCLYDPQLDMYVCGEPPDPNECIQTGNACVADEDCCDYPEVLCIQGFCQPPPPR